MSSVHEPKYTQMYSNETICNYFYYLSIVILSLAIISVSLHAWGFLNASSKFTIPLIASLIINLIQLGIAYYIYLFSYLICSRALLDKSV